MPNGSEWQSELLRIVQTGVATTPSPATLPAAANRNSSGSADQADNSGSQRVAGDPVAELTQELAALRRQMSVAEDTARRQAEQLEQNTRAVLEGSSRPAAAVANAANDGVSFVRSLGGLSFLGSPLINLARRLFSRQNETAAPADTLVSPPVDPLNAQLAIASGLSGGGLAQVNYGADGLPRAVAPAQPAAPAAAQSVTIQVQAMDSRSFIDHSDQIARAVREAMLHSHSLNDVVGDM